MTRQTLPLHPISPYYAPAPRRPLSYTALLRQFWDTAYCAPALLGTAAWFLLLGDSVAAVAVMGAAFCLGLCLSRSLIPALLPLLLALLCSTDHYDNLTVYLRCAWLLPPVLAAAYLRLRRTPRRRGACRRGLVAVSAALLLGGLGRISAQQYLSPLSLYYTLALSVGMLAAYRLCQTDAAQRASAQRQFLRLLYAAGLFAAFLVFRYYGTHLAQFLRSGAALNFSFRNYCATMLLLALPVPFFEALRRPRRLLLAAPIYLALLMTGSRSGLLFGSTLMALGFVYLLHWDRKNRRRYRRLLRAWAIPALAGIGMLALALFASRYQTGSLLTQADTHRLQFLRQAVRDFLDAPLFGQGLGNQKNAEIFSGVPGSLVFYHNYVAQIFGSLGLAGAAAYALQLRDRIALLLASWNPQTSALGLSALGMLLISMTNPGAFCPMPYEFLMVVLFALLEPPTLPAVR